MNTSNQKTVVITGGAQGIGKGIARYFLQKQWRVHILDTDEEAGEETTAEYQSLGDIQFFRTDVSNESDIQSVAKQIGAASSVHALINNAGITALKRQPLAECALEDWNRIITTNLTGTFLCAKYFAPLLQTSNGSIVNIASTRAFQSEPNTFAYSASKGGIISLTHSLAASLDIRVNCISPGWIEVGDWKKTSQRQAVQHSGADKEQHWSGRVGVPDDIAALTFFLCSNEAGFITGQNFIVDGGMSKKMIYVE